MIQGEKVMAQAKAGDKVRVHYTGTFDDGTVFDSSAERGPLEVTIGTGMVIPGFDRALVDMEPGQKKTVNIPVDEAYGPRAEELVAEIGRDRLPTDMELEIGQQLQLSLADGGEAIVLIVDLSDSTVTLDANHPMAGLDLNFELELVEIL
jgi:peptidylprolyl isomerase